MNLILLLLMALPQDYINLIMDGKYEDAIEYCDMMIEKGKKVTVWKLEKGDIYLDKIGDFDAAVEIYRELIGNKKQKDGWLYYRLALAQEMTEDYLNAAKSYEIVATQYRKPPLDSFALSGVERCFKKNYQDYVASIDGYNITRLELDEQMAAASRLTPKDEESILDRMILQRLIYASAVKHGIRETEFFREGLGLRRRRLLIEEIRARDIMGKAQPTEKEMKKYYNKNKEDYLIKERVKAREIVVESDSLAQVILDSLQKDIESYDTLAKTYSTALSKRSGGNMGTVYKASQPEPVDEALFKADLNQVIGPIQFDSKFGIYIVAEHSPQEYREFERVKNSIEATLRTEKYKEIENDLLKKLMKKASIKIYEESLSDSVGRAEDKIVAVVNDREILESAARARNEAQGRVAEVDLSEPEAFKDLLDKIIEEDLQIEHAERNKYFLNDGYVVGLKDITRELMEGGLYRKIVIEGVVVDSQEISDFYKEHKEEFKVPESVQCQEIVVASKKLADELRRLVLKDPEKFDSLARVHSTAPTSKNGGATGKIVRNTRSKIFDSSVFNMDVGTISKVFAVDDSTYTIVKLNEHIPTMYRPLDEVSEQIEARLLRQRQREVADAFLAGIREEADIKIFSDEPDLEQGTQQEAPKEGSEQERE